MEFPREPGVLILSRWYPPESGHFIADIARSMALYCDVSVLVVIPDENQKLFRSGLIYASDPDLPIQTVRVYFRNCTGRFLSLINPLLYLLAQIKGYRFLRRNTPPFRMVFVHVLTRTAIFALGLKLLKGTPYAVSEYWCRYFKESNGYKGFIRKTTTTAVVRLSSCLIPISNSLKRALDQQNIKSKSYKVIPLAIDHERFTPEVHSGDQIIKKIIHISTFNDHSKNVKGIIRATRHLLQRRDDFELHMIGGSEAFLQDTIDYAKTIDPSGQKILFHGPLFGKDLVNEIRKSTFLVMFSNFETFCAVIQECLSCGKPVVTSKACAIPEYVDERSGILIEPRDEAALAEAMNTMLDHYLEYDPAELRKRVIEKFNPALIGKMYYDIYNQVTT